MYHTQVFLAIQIEAKPTIDTGVLLIVLQLIFLESILSLDNAAVLGAMVAPLPNDQFDWSSGSE